VGYGDTPVRPMPRITAGSLLNLILPYSAVRRVLRELLNYTRLFDLGARRAGAEPPGYISTAAPVAERRSSAAS
jgi:hypothetical protein